MFFWVHGGGLTSGSGNQFDGALLAKTDRIVVVSINYRLGVLGFFALPSPSAGGRGRVAGDFGLLDQEAALRWTYRNIAAFGGDRRAITIGGESSGGESVCALMTSPAVRGLFARAVIQSGSCASAALAAAEQQAAQIAAAAGCVEQATAPECLRSKTTAELLAAAAQVYARGVLPIAGVPGLPVAPASVIASGAFARVPLLIGTNHDEGRSFTQMFAQLPESAYAPIVQQFYGANAPQVLARYPWSAFPHPYTASYALGAIWTDSGFIAGIGGCPAQRLEQRFRALTSTYAYQFDDRHATGGPVPGLPGYRWGAAHSLELAYMWPSVGDGALYAHLTPAQRVLSDEMVQAWGAFIRSGKPSSHGLPPWPSYRTGYMMSLRPGGASTTISDRQFAAEHLCNFWDSPRPRSANGD